MSIANGIAALERLKFVLANVEPRIIEVGTLEGISSIKAAVFNRGETQDGALIGSYKSEAYKRKRTSRGRQVQKVDLEFTGELRNSLQRGRLNGKLVVGWTNSGAAKISQHLEERYKRPIFAPQEKSVQRIKALAEIEFKKMLQENGL